MELVVLALLALTREPMFLQVGVVDAKRLRQRSRCASPGLSRLGILVGKLHSDFRLLPGGPRRGRNASDSLKVPAILGGPPVDRPHVGHAVDGGHGIGVRGSAVSKEDAFQPAASHVAIGVAVGPFGWQLVQDTLSEAQQQLPEASPFDTLPWRMSI